MSEADYAKIGKIGNISSEQEFEDHVAQMSLSERDKEWVIGIKRGKNILELIKRFKPALKNALVLDMGSGFGSTSLILSSAVKNVIAVDVNKDLLSIVHKRSKFSEKDNIYTLLCNGLIIPIKSGVFDLILLIGVLEWVPLSRPADNPETTQLKALAELRRLLKDGGMLLIAIENRFFLKYWLGGVDHHSGLRMVPILPQVFADLLCKITRGGRYLNRTYSYFELKKILAKKEFKGVKVLTGIPGYGALKEAADITNRNEVNEKIGICANSMSYRQLIFLNILNKTGLLRFFCSNFVVICRK